MKTTYILIAAGFLVLIGGIWLMIHEFRQSPSIELSQAEAERFVDASKISYTSEQGDITVEYVGDLARVNGGVYDTVVFRQVVATSGAKYEADQGLTLWTQNNEVRISTPQQIVYTGMAVMPDAPLEVPVPVPETESSNATTTNATTSDEVALTDGTWVWQSATTGGGEVTPKKTDAFSLTFSSDGGVTGTTDCNGFGGDYTTSDNSIEIGALRSTLMFCENSEESLFLSLLKSPLTIQTLTETALIVKNADGEEVRFGQK